MGARVSALLAGALPLPDDQQAHLRKENRKARVRRPAAAATGLAQAGTAWGVARRAIPTTTTPRRSREAAWMARSMSRLCAFPDQQMQFRSVADCFGRK